MGGKHSHSKEYETIAAGIYKKYGEAAIKNILAMENSRYFSLSYDKIMEGCEARVSDIEKQGEEMITSYIRLSEEDYLEIVRDIEKKNPDAIKQTEYALKLPFREIIGLDQQLEKYTNIKETMSKDFQDERYDLKKAIRREVIENQKINERERYPEFHDLPEEKRIEVLEEIEEHYAKEWYEEEKRARDEGSPLREIYQFNFSKNFQPKFMELLPK